MALFRVAKAGAGSLTSEVLTGNGTTYTFAKDFKKVYIACGGSQSMTSFTYSGTGTTDDSGNVGNDQCRYLELSNVKQGDTVTAVLPTTFIVNIIGWGFN